MSAGLGELIEQRRGAIVARFIALLRQRLGSHEELSTSALRDHIPDLLSSLAADLRGGDIDARQNRAVLADAHGALRWEQGFDLREVVGDYAILHEAILLEAEEAQQAPSAREARRLVQQISGATSAAVSSYVELRSAQERAHKEQLEALHRARHEVISVLSHELNTPLHIIQLSTQLLRSRDPALVPVLEVVERNSARLSTLIDELLDMADLVTGRIRLSWGRVDLCEVAREAIAALTPTARAKGIQLDEEITNASGVVEGDRARLYQCIWQLLSNAVKFTPRGGQVRLSLFLRESTQELVVSDNGRGMSKEFASRAFEPFTQQDMSTIREFSGLGLGLAFVRHVVELHGGSIDAVSEGQGAAFRLRLPAPS
jgi:signal transduction histidine kinase